MPLAGCLAMLALIATMLESLFSEQRTMWFQAIHLFAEDWRRLRKPEACLPDKGSHRLRR